ncbi:uncharacterized protein B0I36DRAFT_356327 [Microdochium trichocladiopsis]|uniref:Uncharacterized protein n=1 Tax=Microdochium trichocladiopsis TaxID=1682393 RepID=A0A9P9BFK9_9PEZI|nr:uncharacterized protein B0I36DRAFT_356327 [Microdochium trichocladiopsis]KAH7012255.1 hypothetical protein B0I36DRAFT_356327 [Microdochium trichocladiopsis]
MLQAAAINAHGEERIGEASVSQRTIAGERKIELVKELEHTTAEIHHSHQRYNRAEAEKRMIEEGRAKVANLPDSEFWIGTATEINKTEATDQDGERRAFDTKGIY